MVVFTFKMTIKLNFIVEYRNQVHGQVEKMKRSSFGNFEILKKVIPMFMMWNELRNPKVPLVFL